MASGIFLALFTFYLAVDIIKSIGDNIRVRLGVKSLLLALRSFLWFALWNYALEQHIDRANHEWWDRRQDDEFFYRTLSSANMWAGIVSTCIVLLVAFGYGTPYKKLHPFISRILGYCLLAGIGSSLLDVLVFSRSVETVSLYYAVASLSIVYDLQYL